MISLIVPIANRFALTQLSMLSFLECLGGRPYEILLVQRDKSDTPWEGLNYRLVKAEDLEFGQALNKAAAQISPASKSLFFLAPGMVLYGIDPNIFDELNDGDLGILGFATSLLRNPKTGESMEYPSWLSMGTRRESFEQFGGFSEYLSVLGGDFLYSLQVSQSGRRMKKYERNHYIYEKYPLVDSPETLKIHEEIFVKRAPMVLKSKGLWVALMNNWPGIRVST